MTADLSLCGVSSHDEWYAPSGVFQGEMSMARSGAEEPSDADQERTEGGLMSVVKAYQSSPSPASGEAGGLGFKPSGTNPSEGGGS